MIKNKTQFYCIKMEFQKTINSLDITSDNKDLLKNRSKFMINKKKITVLTKKLRLKDQSLF